MDLVEGCNSSFTINPPSSLVISVVDLSEFIELDLENGRLGWVSLMVCPIDCVATAQSGP